MLPTPSEAHAIVATLLYTAQLSCPSDEEIIPRVGVAATVLRELRRLFLGWSGGKGLVHPGTVGAPWYSSPCRRIHRVSRSNALSMNGAPRLFFLRRSRLWEAPTRWWFSARCKTLWRLFDEWILRAKLDQSFPVDSSTREKMARRREVVVYVEVHQSLRRVVGWKDEPVVDVHLSVRVSNGSLTAPRHLSVCSS